MYTGGPGLAVFTFSSYPYVRGSQAENVAFEIVADPPIGMVKSPVAADATWTVVTMAVRPKDPASSAAIAIDNVA